VLYCNQKKGEVYARHCAILWHCDQDVFQPKPTWYSHFHAIYGEFHSVFAIESLEMIEGDLPTRSRKLVKEWAEMYQDELLRMWQTNEFKQLPGLE
jgi:Domain of unknown function (DUF4160)